MAQGINIIERAFQVAPECESLVDINVRLKREGYSNVDAHLGGGSIRADLRKRLKA